MLQVLTANELQAKGIRRRDVVAMLKRSEARVASYAKQYARAGFRCSAEFQSAWDAECARWDRLKATMASMQDADASEHQNRAFSSGA